MVERRKILVAVTGMSPQIVTETIYALYCRDGWLPEKVYVLTTQTGADNISASLLGREGFFENLCAEYGLGNIDFNADNIRVIRDALGQPLVDIRTPEENSLAADQIVRFIHDLCADEYTELHVSIAGGRKSMGFYIGYALSLFGRRWDKLSHVLVEEAFEQNRDFFYPPKSSRILDTPLGLRDAAAAKVMLADIPFVRMREGMPQLALDEEWSFSQAVALTQQNLADFRLVINCADLSIVCHGTEPIKLPVREFCFYLAMAEFKLDGKILVKKRTHQDYELLKKKYWHHYQNLNKKFKGKGRAAVQAREEEWERLDKADKIHDIWKEVPSTIKKKLKKRLGDFSKYFEITSSGKRNKMEYQLAADKENIEIRY
ncbi:CRISPR-associated ring nuclease Csm6 [Neisseria sp. S1]|uniref:CRISPR-associated ring nuclease Csm6 n=1 Tax=Neisseria sp. S1 TaxID=3318354 RepID=UPI003A8791DF